MDATEKPPPIKPTYEEIRRECVLLRVLVRGREYVYFRPSDRTTWYCRRRDRWRRGDGKGDGWIILNRRDMTGR